MSVFPMVFSLLIGGLSGVFAPEGPPQLSCDFDSDARPVFRVRVAPRQGGSAPGVHGVVMWLEDRQISGRVTPLASTAARDVVMRGVTADRTTYMMALKDNGTAFLRWKGPGADAPVQSRTGRCTGHGAAFDLWLSS